MTHQEDRQHDKEDERAPPKAVIVRFLRALKRRSHMPLTLQELNVAASFLRQAKNLCESVRDFFFGNDANTSARLAEIAARLDDEREYVERLIAKAPGEGAASRNCAALLL